MHQLVRKIILPIIFFVLFLTSQGIYGQEVYRQSSASFKNGKNSKGKVKTDSFLRTELYFGMKKQDGEISDAQFSGFLDKTITPEFPNGLTVLNGIGQFRDSENRIVQEKSRVLILFYPKKNRKDVSRKIELIRKNYKQIFQQESVLRVDNAVPVRMSF